MKHPAGPPVPVVSWDVSSETVECANEDIPADTLEIVFSAIGGLRDGSACVGSVSSGAAESAGFRRVVCDDVEECRRLQQKGGASTTAAAAVAIVYALPLPPDGPIAASTGEVPLVPTLVAHNATASVGAPDADLALQDGAFAARGAVPSSSSESSLSTPS